MSLISFSPLQDGVTGVNAAATNTPLSTIYNDYNGNITDANIASSASINFSKIAGGSSNSLIAWQSWTPTLSGATLGNGTLSGQYTQIGKFVICTFAFTLGSTSSITGLTFSLPITAASRYTGSGAGLYQMGVMYMEDSGVSGYTGMVQALSTTTARVVAQNVAGTYAFNTAITGTVPFTWGTGDFLTGTFTYEAA